jgi:hypothetical protein
MENLEINDIPRQAFGDVEVKKSWTKTKEKKVYPNEAEIISKASKAPHHLVCMAFGITEEELKEILNKK